MTEIVWRKIDGPNPPPKEPMSPGGFGPSFLVCDASDGSFIDVASYDHSVDGYVLDRDGDELWRSHSHWSPITLPTSENTER